MRDVVIGETRSGKSSFGMNSFLYLFNMEDKEAIARLKTWKFDSKPVLPTDPFTYWVRKDAKP